MQEHKEITVLIGDDAAASSIGVDVSAIVSSMWKSSDKERTEPIRVEREGEDIVIRQVPFADSIRFRCVATPVEAVRESADHYDWKITDLNYGPCLKIAGTAVARDFLESRREGETVALYTSAKEDDILVKHKEYFRRLRKKGINYIVSPHLWGYSTRNKFQVLGEFMVEHYEKGKGLGEWPAHNFRVHMQLKEGRKDHPDELLVSDWKLHLSYPREFCRDCDKGPNKESNCPIDDQIRYSGRNFCGWYYEGGLKSYREIHPRDPEAQQKDPLTRGQLTRLWAKKYKMEHLLERG